MRTAYWCSSVLLVLLFFASCVSLATEPFSDDTYPTDITLSAETARGCLFYGDEGGQVSGHDMRIRIKNGRAYPVSNPLLALDGLTAEGGALNFLFGLFSGDDGHLRKQSYKAYLTVDGDEQVLKRSMLLYKDERGRQYIKRSFTADGTRYTFQHSFSDFFVAYPYMFCELQNGDDTYKVFAVDGQAGYEKRFVTQGILNERQQYVIFRGNALVARFTRTGYVLYATDSPAVLKKSIAVIAGVFRFIAERENARG